MIIKQLNSTHIDELIPFFDTKKYMGSTVSITNFSAKENIIKLYHTIFVNTYLTNLTSYHAFGAFDEGKLIGVTCCHQSLDEPSWYGTQIRLNSGKRTARALLDHMIKFNEESGRYKFYTLWNAKHAKILRRFNFSDWANERYDYFDECIVPAKTKCLYTNHWQILFNRILLPVDTVVRCTFLKQQYRKDLVKGGNI